MEKAKGNALQSIGEYFKSIKDEMRKVRWAKKSEFWKGCLVVCVLIGVTAILVGGMDALSSAVVKALFNLFA